MDHKEAFEALEKLLIYDSDTIARSHQKELFRLYSFFFDQACSGCGGKLLGYIERLRSLTKEDMEKKEKTTNENQFKLKKGFLVRFAGTSEAFSCENLNDKIAINYLRINPNRIDNFQSYPQNWQEMLKENFEESKEKVSALVKTTPETTKEVKKR